MSGRWLREPLVWFLVVGAAVLVIDRAVGSRAVDVSPSAGPVVVDEAVIEGLRHRQIEALGRPPRADELAAAVEGWIDEELLVREAQALGLGRGDPVIRGRLAARMAELYRARAVPDVPGDAELRALYAAHAADYRLPTRLTVRQVFVAAPEGEPGRAEARGRAEALAERLRGGAGVEGLQGVDPAPGGPLLRGRRVERLAEVYGAGFVEGLEGLEIGAWAVRPSAAGWHVLRVEERSPGRALGFEAVRDRLVARWVRAESEAAAARAVEALRQEAVIEGWPR